MIPIPETLLEAPRSEREAIVRLGWTIVPAALVGIFLAELFVMRVLGSLGLRGAGLGIDLLDSSLLTLLVLPGLYFVVLRPVARLSAALSAASANARFRAVVEAATDGIIVGDLRGRIRFANPAASRMLGYAPGEMDDMPIATIVPEDLRERHEQGMNQFLKSGEGKIVGGGPVELKARTKNGASIPVEIMLSAPTLRKEGLMVAVMRDLRQSRRLGLYEALLPVCCGCGRIRDDSGTEQGKGAWHSLEDYVERHASARFSHGYCAGCAAEYRRTQGLPPAA